MDASLWALFGVIGIMAGNQLVMRLAGLKGNRFVFYPLQLVNLLAGAAVFWFGLPGFDAWPVIGWMIGLLLFFRVVQNNSARVEWLNQRQQEAEGDARREAIEDALRKGKGDS